MLSPVAAALVGFVTGGVGGFVVWEWIAMMGWCR